LLAAGTAVAQDDFPKIETAPAFMYVHFVPGGGLPDYNCVGGGGTIAYNMTSWFGVAADLGGCKTIDLQPGTSANLFTYVFGPRITYRSSSKFQPFFLVNFGGSRISVTDNDCSDARVRPQGEGINFCGTASKNAFAMTVGGGVDYKMTKKIALRLVQAEYFYTRFGNNFFDNVNQNNFRLKSGVVISWGGGS
jgi:opacity protein-like surface antigen